MVGHIPSYLWLLAATVQRIRVPSRGAGPKSGGRARAAFAAGRRKLAPTGSVSPIQAKLLVHDIRVVPSDAAGGAGPLAVTWTARFTGRHAICRGARTTTWNSRATARNSGVAHRQRCWRRRSRPIGSPGVASHLLPLGDQSRRRRSSLSFSQERMAFMQALAVGSAAYHVAFGLRLRGELNAAALASALGELSAHHEVLRLRFIPAAEGTVPVAGASLPIRMQVISASGDDEVFTAASEFCNAPFDLERGNVARAALIQRTRKDSLLVLVFHHIVMDQWSYEILLEELARAYARNVGGDHSGSTRQDGYAGYAIWHRHWFREHAFASDRSYWLEQLNGASRVSFLPDFPRPDEPTYPGRSRQATPGRGDLAGAGSGCPG